MVKNICFLLIATYICVSSCTQKDELLDNEKLSAILTDMHISEVAIKRSSNGITDSIQNLYLEKLEVIHKMDREEIKKQVELLMHYPDRQSEIYTLVTQKLQSIEKEIKFQKDKRDNTRFNK